VCKIESLSCASKWVGVAWLGDDAAKSCWRWRYRVKLVMTLPSFLL
jgi:hypothetical protein